MTSTSPSRPHQIGLRSGLVVLAGAALVVPSIILAAAGASADTVTQDPSDTTAPGVYGLSATPEPATTGDLVTIWATADDTGGSGIVSGEYNLDGGSWAAMSAGDDVFDEAVENIRIGVESGALSQGRHTICVRATDAGGNQTLTPPCSSFIVQGQDTAPPSVSGVAASPEQVKVGDKVTVSAKADDASTVASASYRLDDGRSFDMATVDGDFDETAEDVTADVATAALSPGRHTFCVVATGGRGLESDGSDCVTWNLRAAGDDGGSGGADDRRDQDPSVGADDDDNATGSAGNGDGDALRMTGASATPVAFGLGLVAIVVGGFILTLTRLGRRYRG